MKSQSRVIAAAMLGIAGLYGQGFAQSSGVTILSGKAPLGTLSPRSGFDRSYDVNFDRNYDTTFDRGGFDTRGTDRTYDRSYDTSGFDRKFDQHGVSRQ
jgi:hypothetical protein